MAKIISAVLLTRISSFAFVLMLTVHPLHACQSDEFTCMFPASYYETGSDPSCLASGDFNLDGKTDFVVANYGDNNLSLFLGAGRGRFVEAPSIPTGSQPNFVLAEDFDADGNLDIAVAIRAGSSVSILLGNGDATFQSVAFFAGTEPRLLASGDFDNDQDIDLAVVDGNFSENSSVSILLNDSAGNFSLVAGSYEIDGQSDFEIFAAEFNGDTNLDLVVATSESVYVLFGKGDGTFNSPVAVLNDPRPPFAVGDVDNDMDLDLIGVQGNPSTGGPSTILYVLLNDGNGDFCLTSQNFSCLLIDIGLADFNEDGLLDVAMESRLPQSFEYSLSVLMGIGDGTFLEGPKFAIAQSADCLTIDHFNGDGQWDVALTHFSDCVTIMIGEGGGSFFAEQRYSIGQTDPFFNGPQTIAKADLNNDSIDDLVTVNFYGNSLSIFLGQPNGKLLALGEIEAGGFPRSVGIADVDRDSVPDLIVTNHFGGTFAVGLGNGDGTFEPFVFYPTAPGPSDIEMIDINGDDSPDVVIANQYFAQVSAYLGNNDGTFAFHEAYPVSIGPRYLASGDLNLDGLVDLVVAYDDITTLSILLGNSNGSFDISDMDIGVLPRSLDLVDLDNDGALDVVFLPLFSADNGVHVLYGNGNGTFDNEYFFPLSSSACGICFSDMNGDSLTDLVVSQCGRFSVFPGLGDGTFGDSILTHGFLSGGSIIVGDFDGDTDLDVAAAGEDTLSLMINDCTLIGDVNLDGNVDLLDVAPFVDLIVSGDFQAEADINGDCSVDLLDVQPFIDLL